MYFNAFSTWCDTLMYTLKHQKTRGIATSMFEPKTITEKRMAVLESLFNQMLNDRVDTLESFDPLYAALVELSPAAENKEHVSRAISAYKSTRESEKTRLKTLLERWAFIGHAYKDAEAKRLVSNDILTDGTAATREWVEPFIRANSGVLMCFGTGLHNADPALVGNDAERYAAWLANLEEINSALSDIRESSYLRDGVMGEAEAFGGIPVLFINGTDYLYLVAMTNRVVVQTISVRHLPNDWDWGVEGQWRVEVFSYVDTLSKSLFLRQYMTALKKEGQTVFYVPDTLDNAALTVATTIAEESGMTLTTVVLSEINDIDEAANDTPMEEPVMHTTEVMTNGSNEPA